MTVASQILPGFDDAVTSAQATFRAALDALSQPGTVTVAAQPQAWPTALSAAMSALLLTLADGDTPVWLPPSISEQTRQYLRFHCGCPLVTLPVEARFVVVPAGCGAPDISDCDAGDPAYPDRSATLLLEVDDLEHGPTVSLTGPGIQDRRDLAVKGLPPGFWSAWQRNHARFPLGLDVFFVQGERFAALPRTALAREV